jgi:tetratricopeptide (TPR) repeat protein
MSQVLNTRSTAEALRNIEEAIGIAEELHRKHPNDDEVSRRLAGLYQSAALSLRMGEQRPRALELSTKSRDLFRQLLARHPEDSELHSELAGVMSNAGVIQGGLGQLSEARASLETAIAEWEKLAAKEPSNNGIQRFRMLAYSHLGDLLGNPNYTNLGDTAGAIGAYRSMIAVAEVRYRANPGDQGATIDYGMALARTAAIPAGSTDDRLELYRKSASLLHEALERDPANTTVAMNLASHKDEAGDLLVAAGRLPEARVSFRQGLDLLRGQKARSSPPAIRVALSIARKLGEDAAKRGNRAEALSMAALSLEAVEKVADKDPMPAHVNQARAFASAASIHLALGSEDEARRWFERSMELYRNLQGRPGFTSAHRKQMQGVEASLAKLTKEEARR